MSGEIVTEKNVKVGDLIVIKDNPEHNITKAFLNQIKVQYEFLKITKFHTGSAQVAWVEPYDAKGKKLVLGISSSYISIGYEGKFDCYKYIPFNLNEVLGNLDKLAEKLKGVKS